MRPIPKAKEQDILAQLQAKASYRDIKKSLGVSLATIGRIAKKHDVKFDKEGGRPKSIDDHLGRRITRAFVTGEFTTAAGAARKLRGEGYDLSAQTIRRHLKKNGFHAIRL